MSRIGKVPVLIPENTSLDMVAQGEKGTLVVVKGKLGSLQWICPKEFDLVRGTGCLEVKPKLKPQYCRRTRQMWGTSRTKIANLVKGVSQGETLELVLVGVGYKAVLVSADILKLSIGYSNDRYVKLPKGITVELLKPTAIKLSGIDKDVLGDVAAQIKAKRKRTPYKDQKGIGLKTDYVIVKEGKKK